MSGYVGSVSSEICYPGCPVTVCEGAAGSYTKANPDCEEGSDGAVGEAGANSTSLHSWLAQFGFKTNPAIGNDNPDRVGIIPINTGLPQVIPTSILQTMAKYMWWIVGGGVALILLKGEGRR